MLEKIKVALLGIIAVLLCGILFTLNMPQVWSEDSLAECGICGAHNSDGKIIHICWSCAEFLDEK